MAFDFIRYFRDKPLPLIEQKRSLLQIYPGSFCRLDRNVLTWKACLVPTALSRSYDVTLVYNVHKQPRVYVGGESLRELNNPRFPHHFEIDAVRKKVRVCLYFKKEFTSSKLISKTIVPWIAEWLFHYEVWLATEEWCGGGLHPRSKK